MDENDEADETTTPFETQLFNWKKWDQHDVMCFGFGDCELVTDVGPYKKGDKIPYINMSYDHARMEFINDNGKIYFSCKLKLSVELDVP